jgi:Spy/CpxP family protein refolding chaperone
MADFLKCLVLLVQKNVEGWMRLAFIVTAVLAFPLVVAAQRNITIAPATAPQTNSQGTPTGITSPGFSFPGGFTPPAGLFDQFWNDPAFTAELHLTDVQRKQLQDAALTQRLSLIDGGADALKALARLSAIMDADQLDDAAYKQQLNNLAAAAGKLVQDVGEMTISPRRVLTAEQWRKLQDLQRAKRAAVRSAVPPRQSGTHAPTAGVKP